MRLTARGLVGVVAIVLLWLAGASPADLEGIEAVNRWSRSQRRRYHRKTTSDRITDPGRVEARTLRTLRVRLPGKHPQKLGVSLLNARLIAENPFRVNYFSPL